MQPNNLDARRTQEGHQCYATSILPVHDILFILLYRGRHVRQFRGQEVLVLHAT